MFVNRMAFHTVSDVIWCKAFSFSLEREALEWFNSLPPNTVENFLTNGNLFGQQFVGSRTHDLTTLPLVSLKQDKGVPKSLHKPLLDDYSTYKESSS